MSRYAPDDGRQVALRLLKLAADALAESPRAALDSPEYQAAYAAVDAARTAGEWHRLPGLLDDALLLGGVEGGLASLTDPDGVVCEWGSRWREAYCERAAILMHDGGLPAEKADRIALREVARQRAAWAAEHDRDPDDGEED